jgi:hypothetical protein
MQAPPTSGFGIAELFCNIVGNCAVTLSVIAGKTDPQVENITNNEHN